MIAWAPDFVASYDSPWSLIQKLSWLNCTPAADVLKASGIITFPSSRLALLKRRCDTVEWLCPYSAGTEEGLTTQARRFVLDVKTNFVRSGIDRSRSIPLHARLRLCPVCIRIGYHSVAHQLMGLARCPLDGQPITNVCPECSCLLPEYEIGDIWPSFSCSRCHASWLANADRLPRVSSMWKMQEAGTIGMVLKWASKLSHATIEGLDALRKGWWLRASAVDDTAKISYSEARIWALHDFCSFPLGASYLGQRPLGLVLKRICTSRRAQRRSRGLLDAPCPQSPMYVFALVRRYLSQHGLVAHRRCIADAQLVLRHSRVLGQDIFEFNRDICPVGYAFILWCARLDNYMRWLRKVPVREWGKVSLLPTQQLLLQRILLNSYVGTLHQTILLQALVKNHDPNWREVASPVLYSDLDPWLPDLLLASHKEGPMEIFPKIAIALEPADGLSELRCDHGRAMAKWEIKLNDFAKILERCDSRLLGFDSKPSIHIY